MIDYFFAMIDYLIEPPREVGEPPTQKEANRLEATTGSKSESLTCRKKFNFSFACNCGAAPWQGLKIGRGGGGGDHAEAGMGRQAWPKKGALEPPMGRPKSEKKVTKK